MKKTYEKAVEKFFPVTGADKQIEIACILVNEAAEIDRLRDSISQDAASMARHFAAFAAAPLGGSPMGYSTLESLKQDHAKLLEKVEGLFRLAKVAGADTRLLRKAIAESEVAS